MSSYGFDYDVIVIGHDLNFFHPHCSWPRPLKSLSDPDHYQCQNAE